MMPFEIEKDGQTVKVYTEDELQSRIDEEVKGLKVVNGQLKDEKRELADKVKAVDEEKRLAEEEKAKRDGDYEKLERLMEERLEKERRERQEALDAERAEKQSLFQQYRTEKVGNALSDLVTKLGAGGEHNEILRDVLKARYEFDYDPENNQVRVSGEGASTIEELAKHIEESGKYDRFLAGSQASGGGSPGSQGGGSVTKKFDQMDAGELTALRQQDPAAYQRLRDEFHNR